jgi:hypothetical protein
MKSLRAIAVLLVVAACVALAGAALASKGSKPAGQLPHSTKVQQATSPAEPAAGDTDVPSVGDNEAGQAGEPAQGHEEPAGQDANHECTGNCQE